MLFAFFSEAHYFIVLLSNHFIGSPCTYLYFLYTFHRLFSPTFKYWCFQDSVTHLFFLLLHYLLGWTNLCFFIFFFLYDDDSKICLAHIFLTWTLYSIIQPLLGISYRHFNIFKIDFQKKSSSFCIFSLAWRHHFLPSYSNRIYHIFLLLYISHTYT